MKSYEQYCGLALALDHVGERWTLLVVRELLSGPKRFSDLARGLPGVATNLLTNRLKKLEAAGVIERRTLPPPARATVYVLSELGRGLEAPVHALVRWGGHFMRHRPAGLAFQPHWLGVALEALLSGVALPEEPISVLIEVPEGHVALRLDEDGVHVATDGLHDPDVRLGAPATMILGLAAGELDWAFAVAGGLDVIGSARAVDGLRGILASRAREELQG
jgi:DNA-binding HxlR family transcriptional regulator